MKLILIHADQNARNHLKKMLDDLDHIVIAESDHPRRLLGDIAKHQPHAIIAGELPSVFEDGTFPPLQDTVVLVPVVRLPNVATDESLISFLKEALEKVWIEHQSRPPRPYSTEDQRLVLMDDGYRKYAQDQKLGTDVSGDPDKDKEIFIRQVHCARRNHQAAQRYLRQLLKTERGLHVEVAYRNVHARLRFWLITSKEFRSNTCHRLLLHRPSWTFFITKLHRKAFMWRLPWLGTDSIQASSQRSAPS